MIHLRKIRKKYQMGSRQVTVLRNIDLSVSGGDFLAIMGPSGSGKSTLLHILGCLDRPTSGTYCLNGKNVFEASDKQLSRFRAAHIGFVFQNFHLIPVLNVFENIELPFLYAHTDMQQPEMRQKVAEVIRQVGLADRVNHRPSELSGGEMQRVAIARAMVMKPEIILADEPTGNLDSKTGREILALFHTFHDAGGTIIMITHDREVASHAGKCIQMKDGNIFV